MGRLSQLPLFSGAIADDDLLEILDKSDTTLSSDGTNKRLEAINLPGQYPVQSSVILDTYQYSVMRANVPPNTRLIRRLGAYPNDDFAIVLPSVVSEEIEIGYGFELLIYWDVATQVLLTIFAPTMESLASQWLSASDLYASGFIGSAIVRFVLLETDEFSRVNWLIEITHPLGNFTTDGKISIFATEFIES